VPQAIVDPEELDRFASDLKAFNGSMHDLLSRLHSQFQRLGDTWRDQEQQKFAQEFDQTSRVLNHFMEESEEYISFLHRKAAKVHNYFGQADSTG